MLLQPVHALVHLLLAVLQVGLLIVKLAAFFRQGFEIGRECLAVSLGFFREGLRGFQFGDLTIELNGAGL